MKVKDYIKENNLQKITITKRTRGLFDKDYIEREETLCLDCDIYLVDEYLLDKEIECVEQGKFTNVIIKG